jgi:hypothetical protein
VDMTCHKSNLSRQEDANDEDEPRYERWNLLGGDLAATEYNRQICHWHVNYRSGSLPEEASACVCDQ